MTDQASKKKRGRPHLDESDRRLPPIGFRPTPQLRQALEGAAQASGWSLTKEIESRLSESFHNESLLGALLTDHEFLRRVMDLMRVKNALSEVFVTNPGAYEQRSSSTAGIWGYHVFDRAVGRAACDTISLPREYEKTDTMDMLSLATDLEKNNATLSELRTTPIANEIADELLRTISEAKKAAEQTGEDIGSALNLNESYRAGDLIGDIAFKVYFTRETERVKELVKENNRRAAALRKAKDDGEEVHKANP